MPATLSVRQTAHRLGTTPRTIQNWINRGVFPNAYKLNPTRPNSHFRIPITDITAFEAQRQPKQ